jgi:lysyl-tRNA synthetase class 2
LSKPQLANDVVIVNYRDAFLEICELDPSNSSIEALADMAEADDQLRASLGDERSDWLDLILTMKILPTFAADRLTVIQHYPIAQAALARACPGDASVADRFEVFMGTTELANGYVELSDGEIQTDRVAADQANRENRGLPRRPIDDNLIDALNSAFPACAGVAMGLERLQMVQDNTDNISNVITFAFKASDD